MTELTTYQPVPASSRGGLHPLDPAHRVIAVSAEGVPARYALLTADGCVGTLLSTGPSSATAVCAHRAWRLMTQRRGVLSRIAVARDATTDEAVAAYYPRVRPGGTIALHDSHFRLRLPWDRDGWALFDENRRAVATIVRECTGRRCWLPDRTVRLEDAARDAHPDLALVLLTALWVIDTASCMDLTGMS